MTLQNSPHSSGLKTQKLDFLRMRPPKSIIIDNEAFDAIKARILFFSTIPETFTNNLTWIYHII